MNLDINRLAKEAQARVHLALCEHVLAQMQAVTVDPENSPVVLALEEECADAYMQVVSADKQDEFEGLTGSLEEWHMLSENEQSAEWEQFHELCAQGTADEMYFYKVLMTQWLVGYSGH